MGRFDEIKNKINANINENGEQRITGQVLNEVLIDEVNTIDEVITELEESIGQGGGGITEEKEVYIGADEPTDDGAKLWIDPTGTPSGGGSSESGGGLNVYCLPVEIMTGTADSPYDFGELSESFIKALGNLETIYLLTSSDNVGSQSIAFTNRIAVPQSDGTIKVTLSCAVPNFLNQTQVYVTYMEININVNGANVIGYYRYTGKQI